MNPASTPAIIEDIDDRKGASGHVRVLKIAPVQPFAYKAGQYVHLLAAGHAPRPYSIATAPTQSGHFNVHVRNLGGGLSAHLATELTLGYMLTIEGPFGAMHADATQNRPVFMVAGGTGIAPMLALAGDIIRRNLTDHGITLIYGARSEADIYCRPELETLMATGELQAHIVTGADTPDIALRRLGPNLAHAIVFASGPDPMMHPVHKALLDHLADPSHVFTDFNMHNLSEAPE